MASSVAPNQALTPVASGAGAPWIVADPKQLDGSGGGSAPAASGAKSSGSRSRATGQARRARRPGHASKAAAPESCRKGAHVPRSNRFPMRDPIPQLENRHEPAANSIEEARLERAPSAVKARARPRQRAGHRRPRPESDAKYLTPGETASASTNSRRDQRPSGSRPGLGSGLCEGAVPVSASVPSTSRPRCQPIVPPILVPADCRLGPLRPPGRRDRFGREIDPRAA